MPIKKKRGGHRRGSARNAGDGRRTGKGSVPRDAAPSSAHGKPQFGERKPKRASRRDEKPRSAVGPRWRTDAPVEAQGRAEEQFRCAQAARFRTTPSRKPRDRASFEARPRHAPPAPKPAPPPLPEVPTGVQTVTVGADESGMRVDRYLRVPLSRPVVQPHPAHRAQRRSAGERQARRHQGPAAGRAAGAHSAAQAERAEAHVVALAEDEKTRAFLKSIILHEDDDVMVLNKPMGLSGAGRLRHHAPCRRHARSAARRGSGRAEAAPRAPARQGHRRLPAGRQDALCGGGAGEDLPLALGAQDLLGAHCRRAEAAPGPHLDLPRQGRARGGFVHAHRASTATRARATRSPITRWSRPRRRRSPGCRSSRSPGARISCAPTWRMSATRSWAIRNISRSRTGNCRAACRTGCICSRAASRCRIRAAARSTSPRRCRRTWRRSWNLLGLDASRYDPIVDAPEE